MKELIPGMFSSVSDAELLLAMSAYDEDASENVTDKFSEDGSDNSQTGADINSSPVSNSPVQ